MRTLKNRRRGKYTRGGVIKKVDRIWTNVSEKSESQAVNDYRRMEEEMMRLLANNCVSTDSNVCLRDEGGVLLEEYQTKCDAYKGYEDETTFSNLLAIKDKIGEIIRLRVQDGTRFPIKLTETEEEKKKRKAHRDRINYWSAIYTEIKKIFDTIREKRRVTMLADVKLEYESLKQQLPFDEAQCKSIKDAYEQTTVLISVLEKEDALLGNGNEAIIALLKERNKVKKELYDLATNPELPQRRIQFAIADKKMKDMGLEDAEEKTRQDSQSRMIQESITIMDREQQRQFEQEEEKTRREEKERRAKEMEREAARQKAVEEKAAQAKKKQKEAQYKTEEEIAIEEAIKDSHERKIIDKWKFLASVTPFAMVSEEAKVKMKQYDAQLKEIVRLPKEEKMKQIEEITTIWEALLDEEAEKAKTKKSALDRSKDTPTEASVKFNSVDDVYRWDNIQDEIEVLPESELKQQLIDIDSQIDALVYSDMDRVEMNIQVKRLMDQGELLIKRNELIKLTRKIHDVEKREIIMRSNALLEEIPDLPIDEKHAQMEKILLEWEEKTKEAITMQTHQERLPSELFEKLVYLKQKRKSIAPEDPRLKVINMHNGLIDKMIYREPLDIGKIAEQLAKWEQV